MIYTDNESAEMQGLRTRSCFGRLLEGETPRRHRLSFIIITAVVAVILLATAALSTAFFCACYRRPAFPYPSYGPRCLLSAEECFDVKSGTGHVSEAGAAIAVNFCVCSIVFVDVVVVVAAAAAFVIVVVVALTDSSARDSVL